jgi:hypothetical protein
MPPLSLIRLGPDPMSPVVSREHMEASRQQLKHVARNLKFMGLDPAVEMTDARYKRLIADEPEKHPSSYKEGGKIPKTGIYKLHKGELVIPVSKVKKVERILKEDKMPRSRSGSPIRNTGFPVKKKVVIKGMESKKEKEQPAKIHVCREKPTGRYKKCSEKKPKM